MGGRGRVRATDEVVVVDGRESNTCFASLVHLCPGYHPQSYQLICQEIIRRKAPKSQSGHISWLKVLTPERNVKIKCKTFEAINHSINPAIK